MEHMNPFHKQFGSNGICQLQRLLPFFWAQILLRKGVHQACTLTSVNFASEPLTCIQRVCHGSLENGVYSMSQHVMLALVTVCSC